MSWSSPLSSGLALASKKRERKTIYKSKIFLLSQNDPYEFKSMRFQDVYISFTYRRMFLKYYVSYCLITPDVIISKTYNTNNIMQQQQKQIDKKNSIIATIAKNKSMFNLFSLSSLSTIYKCTHGRQIKMFCIVLMRIIIIKKTTLNNEKNNKLMQFYKCIYNNNCCISRNTQKSIKKDEQKSIEKKSSIAGYITTMK